MEYGTAINCDYNTMRHVGWEQNKEGDKCYEELFSEQTVRLISNKISELTRGLDKQNRKIIVPDDTICSVLSSVFSSRTPEVGSIYSRYVIPNVAPRNDVQECIDRTIEIIVSQIKNEYEMRNCNENLTAWTTLLGDFNEHSLRSHAPIKIRRKNTSHRGAISFMNY